MLITTYVSNFNDIKLLKKYKIKEAILGCATLSRYGKIIDNDLKNIILKCKNEEINSILEWDVLNTEDDFNKAIFFFKKQNLKNISSIRAQDPGVIFWLFKNTKLQIQIILEHAYRNLDSILYWCNFLGSRLDRVILSNEISKNTLKKYIIQILVPVEYFGLGKLLIFYTPNSLLTSNIGLINYRKNTLLIINSNETNHNGFRLLENNHGSFLFYNKDINLLEYFNDFVKMNLGYFRADLRDLNSILLERLLILMNNFSLKNLHQFNWLYPKSITKGYFLSNKTNIIFNKLKIKKLIKDKFNYLGEVVEIVKNKHTIIFIKNTSLRLKNGDHVKMINTSGVEFSLTIDYIKNAKLEYVEYINYEHLAIIRYLSKASYKTSVYLMK